MEIEIVQKSVWHKRFVLLLLAAFVIVAYYPMMRMTKGAPHRQAKQETVVANTWGWATLKSAPVPVRYRQAPGSHNNIGLMQVEFEMNAGEGLTALVNTAQMERKISPGTTYWKKGDQVLVACIPGQTAVGTDGRSKPSATYMVVDYCPK